MEPQIALTMPLLEGTDGTRKMSKSYGNYIGVTDKADDMFGKTMSIPDELIVRYFRPATQVPVAEVDEIERGLSAGTADPNAEKRRLARAICDAYHGAGAGNAAEEHFNAVHRNHEVPEDIASFATDLSGEVYLPGLFQELGFAKTSSEGRRLIDGVGVKVNGEPLAAKTYNVSGSDIENAVIQAGKLRFVLIVPKH